MIAILKLKDGNTIPIEVKRESFEDVIDYLLGDEFIHNGSTIIIRNDTVSIMITR
jgi:hypothetical protein